MGGHGSYASSLPRLSQLRQLGTLEAGVGKIHRTIDDGYADPLVAESLAPQVAYPVNIRKFHDGYLYLFRLVHWLSAPICLIADLKERLC